MKKVIITILTFFSFAPLAQVNYLDLANLLVNNGNLSRGLEALKKVKYSNKEDESRYFSIYGRYYEKTNDYDKALQYYDKAIDVNPKNLQAFLNKSQVLLAKENYQDVINLLEPKVALKEKLAYYIALSVSYKSLKNSQKAWDIVHQGMEKFPKNTILLKQKWLILVDLKLYQESLDYIISHMAHFDAKDMLGFINEYANRKEVAVSQKLAIYVEQIFPNNIKIKKAIVANYVRKRQFFIAANYLDQYVYVLNNDDIVDLAVRINQKLKRFKRAEFLAHFYQSDGLKLQSKVSELLAVENYEELIQMERRVVPVKLKNKEDVLYAIAYSHYSVGNYKEAIRRLDKLTDEKIIKKAMALKNTVLECIGDQFACSL